MDSSHRKKSSTSGFSWRRRASFRSSGGKSFNFSSMAAMAPILQMASQAFPLRFSGPERAAGNHELVAGERSSGREIAHTDGNEGRFLLRGSNRNGCHGRRSGFRFAMIRFPLCNGRFFWSVAFDNPSIFHRRWLVQVLWMLFQEFFADLGKPVVKAALGDSVQTEICDRRHAALAAVDDDLLPVCDFLLTDSGGIFAQNKSSQQTQKRISRKRKVSSQLSVFSIILGNRVPDQ